MLRWSAAEADAEEELNKPENNMDSDQVDALKEVHQGDMVDLTDDERAEAESALRDVAPELHPDKVLDKLSDDDKSKLEDELQDAAQEEDKGERTRKFLKAATRLAIRTSLITASVVLIGATGGPAVLFLPHVYTSIWEGSDRISRGGTNLLGAAVGTLHKTMRKGAGKHVKSAIKPKTKKAAK